MTFYDRDLSNQYISMSYQDVLQQYISTGSLLHVLDGYGNVVFAIPSASIGDTIITSNMTSSMTVASSSYSQIIEITRVSSSFASSSISSSHSQISETSYYADIADAALSSSHADFSDTSSLSSLAQLSVSASFAVTASFALNAGGSGGTQLQTGSLYPITSSQAIIADTASYFSGSISTAVFAQSSLSSSYSETSSYTLSGGINIPNYDYSVVEYNGPYGQVSKCIYKSGGEGGSLVCVLNVYYTGSLFLGISKSLS